MGLPTAPVGFLGDVVGEADLRPARLTLDRFPADVGGTAAGNL